MATITSTQVQLVVLVQAIDHLLKGQPERAKEYFDESKDPNRSARAVQEIDLALL